MSFPKKSGTPVKKSSGPAFKEAQNTGPAPYPAQHIAGFCSTKVSPGPRGPVQKATGGAFNAPNDGVKAKGRGGPTKSGPSWTQGGTCDPKRGPGPTGWGLTGKFAPGG